MAVTVKINAVPGFSAEIVYVRFAVEIVLIIVVPLAAYWVIE